MEKNKLLKIFFSVLGMAIVWFVGVDRSCFVETCNDCFWRRNIIQTRLFTIPLFQRTNESNSLITLVARELGVPCRHLHAQRLHKQRWWGFIFCCCPCKSGIDGLLLDEQKESKNIHSGIISLVENDPNLPGEFNQRVLVEHDMEYWRYLKEKIFKSG